MVRLLYFVVLLCMVTGAVLPMMPHRVGAEDAQTEQEQARRLFQEGLALAEVDRWAEALSAFRRSEALVSRPSTSYNIANALYRLDRPVEALSELEEYDRMPEVRGDEAARKRGETLRKLLESTVGELHLTVTPTAATLFVDGRPSKLEGLNRRLLLNPGTHSIRVVHDGYEPHLREIQLERGSRQAFAVELQSRRATMAPDPALTISQSAIAAPAAEPGIPDPAVADDDRERFVKRPGFWVMIGVIAAAGIGAGVAVAVARKNDSPACGTTGDCATTQGLTVTSF
jgi:tetratricopeptide (TPR) repeat protein